MRRLSHLLALALALPVSLSLAACGPNGSGDDDDDMPPIDAGGIDAPDVTSEACRKMDLIFIIDDSGSMSQEQGNLATNFPMFANVLNTYVTTTGEELDYRAAITTTGITATITTQIPTTPPFPPFPPITTPQSGDDGEFRQSCGMTRRWLERTDPNMPSTFACAADVGTSGPGIEMQLRAAQLAAMPATNPGFLRDDALLGIVILTDEDDCSHTATTFTTTGDACDGDPNLQMPAEVIASLDQIKGDRGRWAAAVIAGQTNCESSFGTAVEGERLKQFAQQAGANVVFGDICGGDLAPVLAQALDTFQAACDNFPPVGKPTRASSTAFAQE